MRFSPEREGAARGDGRGAPGIRLDARPRTGETTGPEPADSPTTRLRGTVDTATARRTRRRWPATSGRPASQGKGSTAGSIGCNRRRRAGRAHPIRKADVTLGHLVPCRKADDPTEGDRGRPRRSWTLFVPESLLSSSVRHRPIL